jgi:hypothetical protein
MHGRVDDTWTDTIDADFAVADFFCGSAGEAYYG